MLEERPAWQQHALCNTGDASLVDVFFGAGRWDHDGRRAKEICEHCPVAAPCLDDALAQDVTRDFGVWGGSTAHERIDMRRERAS